MSTLHRYADILDIQFPDRFEPKPLNRKRINPLRKHAIFPDTLLRKDALVTPAGFWPHEISLPLSLLTDRPLVVAFFSVHWNRYGIDLLQQLQSLHQDVKVMGGRLLVIAAEGEQALRPLVEKYQLTFPILHDRNNAIAALAGLYEKQDPIWDRVSGVDADVPIPATYVINPAQQVSFAAVDPYLQHKLDQRALLSAVYDAREQLQRVQVA
ncbi:hypothetical protein DCC81_19715 [Chitinophaga parva]|uniref:Alkyl hydroperoxide reductase subunit C/ Thiol specific antioxidant domain-containing protein n=1 Tax=Chitinophaga parva TaxID=2169414 RepID=A0A2T7BC48_9BACT|nr:redoxin domain-containing protein [Chitinophaga parva]PUZ22663.1 hypothetical protein DCC81_19715 [Chitinophaga parva]